MRVQLEDFVPYDRSLLWAIHDAYFAQSGLAAWTKGTVPYYATSNPAAARQHARLLVALVAEAETGGALDPAAPVTVLEVGSGSGEMAANFVRALLELEGGRGLAARLRYVLSDGSRANVEQASQRAELAPLVAQGTILPVVLDLMRPDHARDLEDRPFDPGPCHMVIASYVCCAVRSAILRKTAAGWDQRLVRIEVDAPPGVEPTAEIAQSFTKALLSSAEQKDLISGLHTTYEWSPVALESLFAARVHRDAVASAVARFARAVLIYPTAFLDFLLAVVPKLARGGVVLVNDFGTAERKDLEGDDEPASTHYGNSVAHEVQFALIESFAKAARFGIERTRERYAAIHTAAIAREPLSARARRAFEAIYAHNPEGELLMDVLTGAEGYEKAGQLQNAARLLARAHRLSPGDPAILLRLGELCAEMGHLRHARGYLRRGAKLDAARAHDFDLELGKLHARTGDLERARSALRRSARRHDRAEAHARLGLVHEELGDAKRARLSFARAVRRGIDGELGVDVLGRLLESILPVARDPRATPPPT